MHLAKYGEKWMIIHVLWQAHPQNKTDMTDSLQSYLKPDDPFHHGFKPSEELKKFLNDTHPLTREVLDLRCGESRNTTTTRTNKPARVHPSVLAQSLKHPRPHYPAARDGVFIYTCVTIDSMPLRYKSRC